MVPLGHVSLRDQLRRDTVFLKTRDTAALLWGVWGVAAADALRSPRRRLSTFFGIPGVEPFLLKVALLATVIVGVVVVSRAVLAWRLARRGTRIGATVTRIHGRWSIEIAYEYEGRPYRRRLMVDARAGPPLKRGRSLLVLVDRHNPKRVAPA